jgi:hypothetical protein
MNDRAIELGRTIVNTPTRPSPIKMIKITPLHLYRARKKDA